MRTYLSRLLSLLVAASLAVVAEAWEIARPGWKYDFPRDHGSHPAFKTEWWYFTGNLNDGSGREFGYQLTFFRQGVRPPGGDRKPTSRFVVEDMKFGHFAVTDIANSRFIYHQKLTRGAFGEAGFQEGPSGAGKLVWLDQWSLSLDEAASFLIVGSSPEAKVELKLAARKPMVLHGADGISQKAAGEGHASHYYSATRLNSEGLVTIDDQSFRVKGESWFDHEWATNQLTPEQVGWDWFSVQLDDGTELMLYQMRRREGSADPTSSGTFIMADGKSQHLQLADYTLVPQKYWTSKATGARYPISWTATVPSLHLTLQIEAAVPHQELVLKPIAYWEGAIRVTGNRVDTAVRGRGYMELTGYSGPLVGLSSPEP